MGSPGYRVLGRAFLQVDPKGLVYPLIFTVILQFTDKIEAERGLSEEEPGS